MTRILFSTVIAAAFTIVSVSPVFAANEGVGCGLGAMVFEGKKETVLFQMLASTTNGSFGNQSFGITSGTLGCTNDGIVKNNEKVDVFASVNFENLKQNMAQGQGEYLTSFANLLGVSENLQPVFFTLTQEQYASLIKSEATTPSEMLVALNHELSSHPSLSGVTVQ
jgi:hypothetical protein